MQQNLHVYLLLFPQITALAKANLTHNVPDPDLRAKLTPSYPVGCRRILLHDTYYKALQQDNVEVIASAVKEVSWAEENCTVTRT